MRYSKNDRKEREPASIIETYDLRVSVLGGGHSGMFTQSALSLIHQASVGVLRSIGTIATAAMMKAYHGDSPTVQGEHVQDVLTR